MNKTLSWSRSMAGQEGALGPTLLDRLVGPVSADPLAAAGSGSLKTEASPRRGELSLRECVLRDMARLLNATRLLDLDEARAYPQVARSVVNYGVPPLAGMTLSELDVGYVEEAIRQALTHYEPRLLPQSIEVRYTGEDERGGNGNVLTFEIAAKLWGLPHPAPMLVYTDLDLESGAASVRARPER